MQKVLLATRGLRWGGGSGGDLVVHEGDFAAILADPGTDLTELLSVLQFRSLPTAGTVFWEGRLVGPEGPAGPSPVLLLVAEPGADEFQQFQALHAATGQTVLVATRDPETAAQCPVLYRLSTNGLRRLIPDIQ